MTHFHLAIQLPLMYNPKGDDLMKKEIYDDVLLEEPEHDSKEYKKWEKRLHNSIGWTSSLIMDKVFISKKNGRIDSSALGEEKEVFDVVTGQGTAFTCEDKEHSEIFSLLVQINERLKKVEKKLEETK